MNALEEIQAWYRQHCDGDWDHQYGVRIETLDNPGWLVQIDLIGTALEARHFSPIERSVNSEGWPQSKRWMHCFIREGKWQGAGDETSLEHILQTFVAWSKLPG